MKTCAAVTGSFDMCARSVTEGEDYCTQHQQMVDDPRKEMSGEVIGISLTVDAVYVILRPEAAAGDRYCIAAKRGQITLLALIDLLDIGDRIRAVGRVRTKEHAGGTQYTLWADQLWMKVSKVKDEEGAD